MTLAILPAHGRRERRRFFELPTTLHARDPAFVPMLDAAFRRLFDQRRNPFWSHAKSAEWVALRDGKPVGRIGGCVDETLRAVAPGCGAIGFFDCAADDEAAAALFATALGWLREQGCTRARGPLNYSIHDTAGLLVEGFDTPPTVDTTWNPAYQPGQWEAAGWRGAQDLIGAAGALAGRPPRRAARFAERARRRGVVSRPLDLKRFDEEVAGLHAVYNAAWAANWGHVPIPAADFAYHAQDLRMVMDPDLVRVAECDGRRIGFLLSLPDLNVAVRRCGGRLLPLGWWHLLRARRNVSRARTVALGVVPGFRIRGVDNLLLHDSYVAIARRYAWAEASWVLADNAAMVNGLALHGLSPYKRWRIYERDL